MKKIGKLVVLIIFIFVILLGVFFIKENYYLSNIELNKTEVVMLKDETCQLNLNKDVKKIEWISNNESVATISSDGKITAKSDGTAIVSAKVKNRQYDCKVIVETPYLSDSNIELINGDIKKILLNGTNKNVIWSSSDESVATVSNNGEITAKSNGTAVITAKVGNKKYNCKVNINEFDDEIKKGKNKNDNSKYSKKKYSVKYVKKYLKNERGIEKPIYSGEEYDVEYKGELYYRFSYTGRNATMEYARIVYVSSQTLEMRTMLDGDAGGIFIY